jgi:flagellar motor switch protein FliM
MPVPVILAVFKSPPMQGSMILEISPEVAYMIISRLFGGSRGGESSKQFTEIELALIERILRSSCTVFDEAWEKMIEMNTQVERLETSPQFAQVVALNEPVAVIGLDLKIGEESGIISICVPHTAIEPLAKQLNTRMLYTNTSPDGSSKVESKAEIITEKLERTPVSLITYFDTTLATVSDIVNLQVGDVIRLNHRTEDPVTINVEHIPKFLAKIGSQSGHYALQIENVIREEEQETIWERFNSAVLN